MLISTRAHFLMNKLTDMPHCHGEPPSKQLFQSFVGANGLPALPRSNTHTHTRVFALINSVSNTAFSLTSIIFLRPIALDLLTCLQKCDPRGEKTCSNSILATQVHPGSSGLPRRQFHIREAFFPLYFQVYRPIGQARGTSVPIGPWHRGH